MAWYRAGSVTVTQGSAVVTGAGTDFVSNTSVGEAFLGADGRVYEIVQVVSATQIVLGAAYQGASAGGQGFAVLPTQSFARDLALGAAQLLNTFAVVRDGIGAGLFPNGSQATPAIRFAADQDTGIARTAENTLAIVTGGVARAIFDGAGNAAFPNTKGITIFNLPQEVFTISDGEVGPRLSTNGTFRICNGANTQTLFAFTSGTRLGIGVGNPASSLHVAAGNGTQVTIENTSGNGDLGIAFKAPAKQFNLGQNIGGVGTGTFSLYDVTRGTPTWTMDAAGNFLVGPATGNWHRFTKAAVQGQTIFTIEGGAAYSIAMRAVDGANFSSANAALYVGAATDTGRSFNAAGTINASGADYAEYMLKAAGCGRIAKGDVCGVDHDGRLTKTWADAMSFVVKSTDPSLVGGDTWDADVGPKPEEPGSAPIQPVMPTMPGDGASEDERAAWDSAVADHPAQMAAYQRTHAEWQAAADAHAEALTAWEAAHEEARQCVDRIAFCGQVPVNVTGDFAVGDYIIAAANGAGIQAIAIADAEITFDQYRRRIGKVWALRDGRAWVDVQHG